MSAAIEFLPGRFYLGVWYFDPPKCVSEFKQGGNFLATVWRCDDSQDHWNLDYRFRHYRDARVFDHQDTIHVTHLEFLGTEEEATKNTDSAMNMIARLSGCVTMYIEVRGDSRQVMQKIQGLPMFHTREEKHG